MGAIIATDKGGADFELIPNGTYVARCYMMVHIGTVTETFGNDVSTRNRVLIGFEVPEFTRQWREDEPEMPAVVSVEHTVSLSKKGHLRGILEAWRSQPFTDEQAKSFDLVRLVGAPCALGIVQETTKEGKKYNKIKSIAGLVKGTPVPAQVHPSVIFTYDPIDLAVLETLPEWIKKKVKTSQEYGLATGIIKPEPPLSETAQPLGNEDESELPF